MSSGNEAGDHFRSTAPETIPGFIADEAERLYLNDLMVTHDANEGVRAFPAKRPPRWKDEERRA